MSRQKGREAVVTDRSFGGCRAVQEYRHPLLAKINPFLRSLDAVADPAGRRVRWTPRAAGTAAVLMALDPGCSLSVRCEDALACMGGEAALGRVGSTYNGLVKALERHASAALPTLKADLRRRAAAALAGVPKVAGWSLLAVDGTKEDLPRTRSCERAFGIADNGVCPQAFVTAIVEAQSGILWDWRIDRGRASEKRHLEEMVESLPRNALLLGDGNFVGHRLWSALDAAGKHFLVRVGGNVSLIEGLRPGSATDRRKDIVYAWPVTQQKRSSPLRLRLIRVGPRKSPVYLLTNVLDPASLSRRAAGVIYRLRWGVELFYRTLKRTLGYAKLQSRSGVRAEIELEWALIAATIMAFIGAGVLRRRRIDPRRSSPAGLLRVLRRWLLRGPRGAEQLDKELAEAVGDGYTRRRPKHSRHRPHTRNTPSPLRPKPPKIREATPKEKWIAYTKHPQHDA